MKAYTQENADAIHHHEGIRRVTVIIWCLIPLYMTLMVCRVRSSSRAVIYSFVLSLSSSYIFRKKQHGCVVIIFNYFFV